MMDPSAPRYPPDLPPRPQRHPPFSPTDLPPRAPRPRRRVHSSNLSRSSSESSNDSPDGELLPAQTRRPNAPDSRNNYLLLDNSNNSHESCFSAQPSTYSVPPPTPDAAFICASARPWLDPPEIVPEKPLKPFNPNRQDNLSADTWPKAASMHSQTARNLKQAPRQQQQKDEIPILCPFNVPPISLSPEQDSPSAQVECSDCSQRDTSRYFCACGCGRLQAPECCVEASLLRAIKEVERAGRRSERVIHALEILGATNLQMEAEDYTRFDMSTTAGEMKTDPAVLLNGLERSKNQIPILAIAEKAAKASARALDCLLDVMALSGMQGEWS